jgi:hypothetical protein
MNTIRPSSAALKKQFLSLMPTIERQGRIFFRHLKCVHERQDAMAEMMALTWKSFLQLVRRGKDPSRFPSTLASFVARAVYNGRRLCGQEKSKDVLSPLCQRKHDFGVCPFPGFSSLHGNIFDEALHDNTQTPVLDQVAFRFDFPAWLQTRTDRERRIMLDLMRGERTLDVSKKYGTSPARISQLRRDFQQDWNQFCQELVEADQPISA